MMFTREDQIEHEKAWKLNAERIHKENIPMDIYSESGKKVKFLGKNGYNHQLKEALEFFKPEEILTVKRTNVQNWSSTVEFKEYPGKWWNTVMFGDI